MCSYFVLRKAMQRYTIMTGLCVREMSNLKDKDVDGDTLVVVCKYVHHPQ